MRIGAIDLVQLHGDENGDYIKALKSRVPNRIIKAVRVRSPEDVKRAVEFSCDYLLLDTWHEQHYGGTGNVFDWSLVPKTIKPFFLAGGINSANIAQAIEKLSPYAVDVSSGVETDGYKDPAKILEIVSRARRIKELKT